MTVPVAVIATAVGPVTLSAVPWVHTPAVAPQTGALESAV
jgi:hypothetical protein